MLSARSKNSSSGLAAFCVLTTVSLIFRRINNIFNISCLIAHGLPHLAILSLLCLALNLHSGMLLMACYIMYPCNTADYISSKHCSWPSRWNGMVMAYLFFWKTGDPRSILLSYQLVGAFSAYLLHSLLSTESYVEGSVHTLGIPEHAETHHKTLIWRFVPVIIEVDILCNVGSFIPPKLVPDYDVQ